MSAGNAASLDLGFDVLVPPYIPDPFTDQPEITASDGSYSLYWMIGANTPTFLEITGEVGGEIPDYSKYDRNNQLEQNAEVNGEPAYHDLTPIYDLVYWQVGDVVYSVESRNLTSDDSLSLANSLVSLTAQTNEGDQESDSPVAIDLPDSVSAGEQIDIGISGVERGRLSADSGQFTDSGSGSIDVSGGDVVWQAPSPDEDTSVLFVLADPDTGDWLATANLSVRAAQEAEAQGTETLALACPATATGGQLMAFELSGSGTAIIDAGEGHFPAESPNTDFAPDADGGSTMVGTAPGSGAIDLVWIAPDVDEHHMVYLFASNEAGETPGECDIEVQPSSDANRSTAETATPHDQESGQSVQAASIDEVAQVTPTKKAVKPTKTPVPYDEVRGLPTTAPGNGSSSTNATATITPTPSATARQSATFAPTLSQDGMVASIIGPDGGTLACPLGATVEIPQGALKEPSTVTIVPVANSKLPPGSGIELVPDSGFDVTIAGPDGRAIDYELASPAQLSITLSDKRVEPGMKLYRVDGSTLLPLNNSRIDGDTLTASIDGFSRFVIGSPAPVSAGTSRNLLPFVLAAIVVLLVMIAMVVLGSMFRPRRQRIITSRRPQRTRYR